MSALLTPPRRPVVDDLTRRQLLGGAGVLLVAGACGRDDSTPRSPDPTAGFPVVIEHQFGTTEIPTAPKRIVSVGFTDQDYLLALGVTPVGVREWFGEKRFATWRWARDELADARPAVLPREELNFEQIAALEPDLVTGIYSDLTQQQYDRLSQLAPTLAAPKGATGFGVPWQDQTRLTGRALGRQERTEELVSDVEARFDSVRAARPEFRDATAVIASATGGEYFVYGPATASSQVLKSLGLKIPAEIERLTDNPNSYFAFSAERLDLVDVDLLLWLEDADDPGPAALRADPLYRGLDVVEQGRDLFLGYELYAGALSFSSVLSLLFLLDELVPAMSAAIDGDPNTVADLPS